MKKQRITHRANLFLLAALAVAAAGCGGDAGGADEESPADAASEVTQAAVFDALLFDSIQWPDRRSALDRGAVVYSYSCAKCHGDSGKGDAGYQLQGRILRPPSFQAEDWRFAADLDGLRQAIHEGNDKGMPHFGNAGLTPRDTDAVARYIQRRIWAGN